MWLLKLFDVVANIPNNIVFAFWVAWWVITWPVYRLWYKWQVYQANRELQRYLCELRASRYYHEKV